MRKHQVRLRLIARETNLEAKCALRSAVVAAYGVNICVMRSGTPTAEVRDGGRVLHKWHSL